MVYVGFDFSSKAIDVVHLDLDTNRAIHDRYPLLDQPDSFQRTLQIPDLLPGRNSYWWDDTVMFAVEEPMSRSFRSAVALARVQGALIACLPASKVVVQLEPHVWKVACGLRAMAPKETVAAWAWERWENAPHDVGQDALDAYGIAYACRALCEKAAAA